MWAGACNAASQGCLALLTCLTCLMIGSTVVAAQSNSSLANTGRKGRCMGCWLEAPQTWGAVRVLLSVPKQFSSHCGFGDGGKGGRGDSWSL